MTPAPLDWSLERKGLVDQARHLRRLREAIRERLPDLITEETLITSDGRHVVRVPLKSLEEYKFRYNPYRGDHVGQGSGGTQPGDVLGRLPKSGDKAGSGPDAGDRPGEDVFEVEISVDEVAALLFDELGLPYLQPKTEARHREHAESFRDISKVGLMGNLDKRRTLRANLLKNAMRGYPMVDAISQDDLRFKTWVLREEPSHDAVVIAMRDVSGSMGDTKKFLARTFFYWMVRFLRTRYRQVEVAYVVHHTTAKEVDEDTFFHLAESGGTKVSSAYELCLELIRRRYPPAHWNIYPIHFSDGDNWSDADNRRTVELLHAILPQVNVFGYGEIREGGYHSTLMSAFAKVRHPRFETLSITKREDVYPALKRFFRKTPEVMAP
jgi:sporulation protein YhbH